MDPLKIHQFATSKRTNFTNAPFHKNHLPFFLEMQVKNVRGLFINVNQIFNIDLFMYYLLKVTTMP